MAPITYSVDESRLVTVAGSGELTLGQMLALRERFAADPQVRPGTDALFDFRQVTEFSLTADDIRTLASTRGALPRLSSSARTAIVADRELGYGLFRSYEAQTAAGPNEIRIFRTLDEAEAWLQEGRLSAG